MEGERERLIQAGATPDGEINNTPSGDKLCFLRDPWNVTVQLVQRKTPMI
jgi:glyoxylase I family protein